MSFKKVDRHQLKEETSRGNKISGKITILKLIGTNNLINAVQNYVAKNMKLKEKGHVKNKEWWWKRRIENSCWRSCFQLSKLAF